MSALQLIWFAILAFLVCGYAVLDGFDLGVGVLTAFARDDRRRQLLIRAISPFWDGNEVWLLAAGGASFAAFPPVYATVFSGFYIPMMLLLFALIFRAVAIEFSIHEPLKLFRLSWHFVIAGASAVALFMLGLVVGNLLNGLQLDAAGNYTGRVRDLLNPLALTTALLNMAMMTTHGALYLALRAQGELRTWVQRVAGTAWGAYVAMVVAVLMAATTARSGLMANYTAQPVLWTLPAMALLAVLAVGLLNHRGNHRAAFSVSVLAILGLLGSAVVAIFPRLVPAVDPARSLTIAGSASSDVALQAMLVVAALGMPIVLAYTAWLYWTFRAPVDAEPPRSASPRTDQAK
ncbi:MAG: cytochrome d ubiquinol oxidase subunit II [Armatimonadetes bacterium]|nr:cytochrome d ubiquinol oxidase subunit II [Armatimonadota bacterium]